MLLLLGQRLLRDRGTDPRATPIHLDGAVIVRSERDLDLLADEVVQIR